MHTFLEYFQVLYIYITEYWFFSTNMSLKEFIIIEPLTSILRISRVLGIAPVSFDLIRHVDILGHLKKYRVTVSQKWNIACCIFVIILCKYILPFLEFIKFSHLSFLHVISSILTFYVLASQFISFVKR